MMKKERKEEVSIYLDILPAMLNGTLDWGKGCQIRNNLNVTDEELKEYVQETLRIS